MLGFVRVFSDGIAVALRRGRMRFRRSFELKGREIRLVECCLSAPNCEVEGWMVVTAVALERGRSFCCGGC